MVSHWCLAENWAFKSFNEEILEINLPLYLPAPGFVLLLFVVTGATIQFLLTFLD
jgi:hypothetical protein